MSTAQGAFDATVRSMLAKERLQLAAPSLEGLSHSDVRMVDSDPVWQPQDERDVNAFALTFAASIYPEDEDLV
jgi:hypothetical protein